MKKPLVYPKYLEFLDKKLSAYAKLHKKHIYCKEGCSACCENGDYPISQLELECLMIGFAHVDNDKKKEIQKNILNMKKGGACPFLVDNKCSVYKYRPIICRVHGLAYLTDDKKVKLPYCAKEGKNYSEVYDGEGITINPIVENLDTPQLLNDYDYGEIRNLYDWINDENV